MNIKFFAPLVLVVTLLTAFHCSATTYYIDYASGSDANSGTSKASPWQHAPGMKGCTGLCASTSIVSGTSFVFKGGVVWTNAALPWMMDKAGVTLTYDSTWNKGTVVSVRPTSSGYNCTALVVTLSDGGGSGATATAQFQTSGYLAGLLQHVTLTSVGSGYTSNPTVSFAGSTCDVLPTAVADIYSPVIDAGGTLWTESNGAASGFGPVYFYSSGLTVSHLEFRNALFDHTIAAGSGRLNLLTYIGSGGNFDSVYLHNAGSDSYTTTSPLAFSETGLLSINQGYGYTTTLSNSFFDNYEREVFTACGSGASLEPPCGGSYGATGATTAYGNILHDIRGQLYTPAQTGLVFHDNLIWDTVYDCCGQHEDSFYIYGGGVFYNNVLHDGAPLGAANFYIETTDGATAFTSYFFNNVIWNPGRSTAPFGVSSEFWGTTALSGTPTFYFWNNTVYALSGTDACMNAGQWYGNSSASTVNFYLYNNHCITDQTSNHWYYSTTGNYGTWNGLSNPNSSSTQASIDATNTLMSPTVAASQGYTIQNTLAPISTSNLTVTFSGSNYTTTQCGSMTALCYDIKGAHRPTSGSWNSGAYSFVSSTTKTPTNLTGVLAP